MKEGYKSSWRRLAVFFETSRDLWKIRAKSYQSDKRALKLEVRDLKRSREKWRRRTKDLEAQLKELKKKAP